MLPPVPSLPPSSLWGCFVQCLKPAHYARLSGRSTRREYWSFMLFCCLIGSGLALSVPLGALLGGGIGAAVAAAALLGFLLYTAMPGLAVYVRRLHDVGLSGRWIALSFGLTAVIFGIRWFFFMLAVQELMWTHSFSESSMETAQSLALCCQFNPLPATELPLMTLSALNNLLGIILFVLTLLPSQDKENRYGYRPLA